MDKQSGPLGPKTPPLSTEKAWKPSKSPVGKKNYQLEPEITAKVDAGIKAYLAAHRFDTTTKIAVAHTVTRGVKKKNREE